MLKIEKTVLPSPEQWEIIIEGMRNPMNSWDKMDSVNDDPIFVLGDNDRKLMTNLAKGGAVHAKYRRMIPVYFTVTSSLYFFKELDTYKVGTVCNSCSTMHKIHAKEFTLDDFSHEHLIHEWVGEELVCFDGEYDYTGKDILQDVIIPTLNHFRQKFLETKTKPMKEESKRPALMKRYWWQMIQLLPTSYNQKRTYMMNYEVLHNIYHSRKNHKLDEWHTFCDWIETLPYSELITGGAENA
jgi:hypothetical protein